MNPKIIVHSPDVAFGRLEFTISENPGLLQSVAQSKFEFLFDVINSAAYPHLWKVWNYVPHINEEVNGIERYKEFNAGRAAGFASRKITTKPAACALGSSDENLVIYFLAGKELPTVIENPRQVSAYDYPTTFGHAPPLFSRASIIELSDRTLFFISGTASIVGHETKHLNDVKEQTLETIRNLEALFKVANTISQHPLTWIDLCYTVYVRYTADIPLVKEIAKKVLPSNQITYVTANICRKDLLVEIEANPKDLLTIQ